MTSAPHLVVFTGSGISAESGIQTFRASDGLWEDHPVEEVATPQGWRQDPERVLAFYNQRRDQIRRAKPNAAHKALAALEQDGFKVSVITQNIDDLHERAGSRHVLHLHGEILKARSSVDARLRYPLSKGGIALGDVCDKGSQLRPDVVWFGEAVPLFEEACELVSQADFLLVVGTSLAVMPAASLLTYIDYDTPCALVDPDADELSPPGVLAINATAGEGVPALVHQWRKQGNLILP
ncbi:MAG TPA: NAD-dependent deacylase [Halomonas sp.]|jgi:NAD-dependent deacetylase|uniref:NAD-dependent protein deacylase n=1 Tax=Vreelandella aquamarina TaxID=77097 RepID=A0A6F8SR18_9GAMM|nr:NAD-dependent deacylase [Halomonas meridiana]BCA90731.1 NAD-dependent protein deacylase [Halomonas meridiana]HBS16570.1 NAD-dependent deacylase [Halomonas sp.]